MRYFITPLVLLFIALFACVAFTPRVVDRGHYICTESARPLINEFVEIRWTLHPALGLAFELREVRDPIHRYTLSIARFRAICVEGPGGVPEGRQGGRF